MAWYWWLLIGLNAWLLLAIAFGLWLGRVLRGR